MKTSLPASKTFHFIVLALILSVVLLLSVSTLLAAQVETPPSSESLVAPDAGRYFTLVTPGTANEVGSNATHDLMITATPTEVIGTWSMTGSMNVARGDLGGAVTLADGRVLVAAGSSATGPLGSAELYDPTTGVWTLTGSLNTARMWFGQPVLLADGRVLIAGGTDVSGYNDFASVEVYDRAAGTWSYTGSLNTPRRGARPIRLQDGRVLLAAGAHGLPNGNRFLATSELYDPTNGTWSYTGNVHVAREGYVPALLNDGRVLIAGGEGPWYVIGATAEVYDPATGNWTQAADMASGKAWFTLTVLPDGRVLSAGGYSDQHQGLTTAELFNPTTGTWSPTGSLSQARWGHMAFLLADGRVLVAGGGNEVGTLASNEVYDPATGVWSPGPSLQVARNGAVPAALLDGRWLAVGGAISTSCELFIPTQPVLANLALGRPGYASSWMINYEPDKAFDGDRQTMWGSEASDPQWIYVDLGASHAIAQVILRWENAYAKSYQIQVSEDAVTWQDIYTQTLGIGGTQILNVTGTGRYVRMYGTARQTSGWGYALWEFEVYDHIVATPPPTPTPLPIITPPAGQWGEVGTGSASGGGISNNSGPSYLPSLALNSGGAPYVAWQDQTVGNWEVYGRWFDGVTWQEIGVGAASGGGISNNSGGSGERPPSLALDASNTPYVAWDDTTPGNLEIYARQFDGTSWIEMGTGSASGGGISNHPARSWAPSLAVSHAGVPYVAWTDDRSGIDRIYAMAFDSAAGTWTGGVATGCGGNGMLAFDPWDRLYLVSRDCWNSIWLTQFDGDHWTALGGAANGSPPGSTAGEQSVAIDSAGTPFVAWVEQGNGNWEVYVKRLAPTGWAEVGVGSATGGGISNSSASSRKPSLAIDPAGYPFLAWEDGDRIYVKRFDGANWVEVSPGSASSDGLGLGNAPSLGIDTIGQAYVAWGSPTGEIFVKRWIATGSATATPTDTPGGPTHTPTPTATGPTLTPTPTSTPTPTDTPSGPTHTPTPTPTANPTATATACPTCKVDLVINPPTTTIGVGQVFTLTLQVEAGTQLVDGAAAYVDFNPTRFQVQAITPDTARLPITLQNSYNNTLGQIDYSAGAFSNYPSGTFAIARVRLVALAAAENSPFTFGTSQPRVSNATYAGSSVLRYLRGGTVTAVPVELAILPVAQTVGVGQIFSVTLQMSTGQQPVDTVAAYLDFDPTKLRVIDSTPGATLPNVTTNSYDNNAGTIDYVASTASGTVQGTFTVATIYFEALDYTTSTNLTFHTVNPRRTDARLAGASVLGSTHNGTITVRANLSVQPPAGTIGVGEVFTITFRVKAGSQLVDGAAAYLDFDAAVLQVQAVVPDASKLPITLQNSYNNTLGQVSYAAGALSNFPSGTFAIASVRMVAIAEAPTTALTFHTVTPRASDVTYGGSILGSLTGATRIVLTGTIEGHLTLQRPNPAPHPSWSVPIAFNLYAAGQPNPVMQATPTTNQSGVFNLTLGTLPGSYDACIKNRHTLQSKVPVSLTWGTNVLNLGTLKEGDADNNNVVSILDFSILATTFGKCVGAGGYDDRPDFNEDDCVTILDFSSLASNFGQMGATCGGGATQGMKPVDESAVDRTWRPGRARTGTVDVSLLPASSTVAAGDVFTLTIQIIAGAQPIDGASTYVNFDPAYLQVQAIIPDTTYLPITLVNSYDNIAGRVDYAAGTFFNFPSGTFALAQIRFVVIATPPDMGTDLIFATVDPRKTDITYGGLSVLGNMAGATAVHSQLPTPTPTAVPGICPDYNPPPGIGVEDIQAIVAHWGETSASPGWDARFDLDTDGKVTAADIMRVAALWGTTC